MVQSLATSIYCPKLECTAHIVVEYEMIADPNGKPDPKDPWSEGYDFQPEIVSVEVLGFDGQVADDKLASEHMNNFEEIYREEIKEILDDYVWESQVDNFDPEDA